jgi:hypothetical protein
MLSFGTVALSVLVLTGTQLLGLLIQPLRVSPPYFPLPMQPFLHPLTIGMAMAVGRLANVTTSLSKYVLVYTRLMGDAFSEPEAG